MEQNDADTSGGGFAPTPMNDILAPRADAAPPPEAAPAPAPEASGDTPAAPTHEAHRDPVTGKFVPKEQQADAAPPAAKQDAQAPTLVPVSVAQEERKKRQALEREVAELRAKLAPPPAAQQPPQHPAAATPQPQGTANPAMPTPPTADLIFTDPDRYHAEMVRYQDARFAIWEQQRQQKDLMHAEMQARQRYPDFDEVIAEIEQYAKSTPFAAQEVASLLSQQFDPAGWAYQQGKMLRDRRRLEEIVQKHGSLEAYERSLTANAQQQAPAPAPSAAPLPQSLASARAAGPRNPAPAYRGPTPMSAILGRR